MSVSNHQPEYDEDELLDIERELPPPPLSSSKAKKTKKKNKTSKKSKRKEQEEQQPDLEEEEEEVVAQPEVPSAPEKKKRKVFAEHKLKGDRLALMPSYRGKLEKNRAKNKKTLEDAAAAAGSDEQTPERQKLKAGTISRLESNYLQHANGLLVPYAIVRRVVMRESAAIIQELQHVNAGVETRLRARGKEPPATLTIKDAKQWHFSDNAVELVRAAVQARLETVAEAASDMRRKTGRVTIMDSDVTDAIRFMQTYGMK